MSFKKKLIKLRRDPELFVSDMVAKRLPKVQQFSHLLPAPVVEGISSSLAIRATHRFSVVSAVYNAAPYLDDFFGSLVGQTISFRRNIQLVLVDDGSTDGSSEKMEEWRARYPENIVYVRKENGGQASARNAGIEHVCHPWVTFIDPDDFVAPNYFQLVDRALAANPNIDLVSCPQLFYFEADGRVVDSHPLRSRFSKGARTVDAYRTRDALQLSSATAFFKTSRILENNLVFDEELRPTFEDGKFVLEYMRVGAAKIHFLPSARYYYRKRKDNSSTLDGSWKSAAKYLVQPKRGYLAALESYRLSHRQIPDFVQWTVLYDLTWFFKHLVNDRSALDFLSPAEHEEFLGTLHEIFSHIDEANLLDFDLAGAWFFYKAGWLNLFKQKSPVSQIAYVNGYDPEQGLIKISHFTREGTNASYRWGGNDVFPSFRKERTHTLVGTEFLREETVWLSTDPNETALSLWIDGRPARISLGGSQAGVWSLAQIAEHFKQEKNTVQSSLKSNALKLLADTAPVAKRFENAWLFMDRDIQADDNAEHLYRFVRSEHPEINAFFLLNRDSHDWDRLERDGFRLIAHGTLEHKLALLNSAHMISSHADHYVVSFLARKEFGDKLKRRLTFLQHGVIKHDLSRWLNAKNFDLFVTSVPREYESIAGAESPYKFTGKEVILSGLPRHDRLVRETTEQEKIILVMPTWRNHIVGNVVSGNTREINPDFMSTEFAVQWQAFLASRELEELCLAHGYRTVFFPHLNIQPYAHMFKVPSHVSILEHGSTSIQTLMRSARFLITDYSSVAFEMAIMEKPTIYYQFDASSFYGGEHLYSKGYFEYEADGFGPVCEDLGQAIAAVRALLENDGRPNEVYAKRMQEFFAFRDGNSCQRVFEAIRDLSSRTERSIPSLQVMEAHALSATRAKDWALAHSRWQQTVTAMGTEVTQSALLCLAEAALHAGVAEECLETLGRINPSTPETKKLRAQAKLDLQQYEEARQLWTELLREGADRDAAVRIAAAERSLGNYEEARAWLERVSPDVEPDALFQERLLLALTTNEVIEASQIVESRFASLSPTNTSTADGRMLLLFLKFAGRIAATSPAITKLIRLARSGGSSILELADRAEIASSLGMHDLALELWAQTVSIPRRPQLAGTDICSPLQNLALARACRILGDLGAAGQILSRIDPADSEGFALNIELGLLALEKGDYSTIETLWSTAPPALDLPALEQFHLQRAVALRKQGRHTEASSIVQDFAARFPHHPGGLLERVELAVAEKDWPKAVTSWTELARHAADAMPDNLRLVIIEGLRSGGHLDKVRELLLLESELSAAREMSMQLGSTHLRVMAELFAHEARESLAKNGKSAKRAQRELLEVTSAPLETGARKNRL